MEDFDFGIDERQANLDGRLWDAVYCGRTGVAKRLLEAGADPTRRGGDDRTPLHHAAARGEHEACSLLLAHGADPHAAETDDERGNDPMALALEFGGKTAMVLLKACRPDSLEKAHLSCCRSRTVAVRLASRMGAAELAKAAAAFKWRDVAIEALAKREARELRKAAKQAKPKPAASRGRL